MAIIHENFRGGNLMMFRRKPKEFWVAKINDI
jgi:hypothetical protein